MKTRSTGRKLFAMVMALAMLAAIWASWGARSAQAIVVVGGKTGMFGIARGQTARINVVHTGEPDGRPAQVEMLFLDSMSNVVARSGQIAADGGQSASFDVDANAFIIDGSRVELRAVVRASGAPHIKRDLRTTIEVFDNDTSKTTFGFTVPPEPE
jgi:hypothetical protein